MWFCFCGGSYLHEHNNTFAHDFTDWHFVVVVTLEDLFFEKLACGQVEGLSGPVEPATIEPLLTFKYKKEQKFDTR